MTNSNSKGDDTINWLIGGLCRSHFQCLHNALRKVGLFRGQPPLLFCLWERDGRSQSELANILQIKPATLAKMVARMEKSGFIKRESSPDDHRVSLVFLTETGKQLEDKVHLALDEVEAKVLSGFTIEEKILLRRFLLQMENNCKQAVLENTKRKKPAGIR